LCDSERTYAKGSDSGKQAAPIKTERLRNLKGEQ